MKVIFRTVTALCATACGLTAQSQVSNPPLTAGIVGSSVASTGREIVTVRINNKSAYDIVAYALVVKWNNAATGQTLMTMGKAMIPGLGDPKAKRSYGPSETWDVAIDNPLTGTKVTPVITVDYVKFRDQNISNWGPDTLHLSERIYGAMAEYNTERARLRRILKNGGQQAVVDDLNSPTN